MLKRIVIVSIAIVMLFFVAYYSHAALSTELLSFSLWHVYLFHTISALIVYMIVEFVAEKLPAQAGYAYLMLMFFKIGAFVLIFQQSVFAKETLSQSDKLGLVIPLFLFLIAEAIAVAKLLNSK